MVVKGLLWNLILLVVKKANQLSVFAPTVLRTEWRKKGYTNEYQLVNSCMWDADINGSPFIVSKKDKLET